MGVAVYYSILIYCIFDSSLYLQLINSKRIKKNMPSSRCVVPGCNNRGGHEFPTDATLKRAWVVAIRQESDDCKGKLWSPTSNSFVCRSHFLSSDYATSGKTGKITVIIAIAVMQSSFGAALVNPHFVGIL